MTRARADDAPAPRPEQLKSLALAVGFDLVGVAAARATPESRKLGDWLARGFAGDMAYLDRTRAQREDPSLLFEGARSVIAVGLVHAQQGEHEFEVEGTREGTPPSSARVARYARGDDYHEVLGDRLRALAHAVEAWVAREGPVAGVRWRVWVDTGPVMERGVASQAGIGWIGKNTCLIHPTLGSYVFLGVLVCDLDLEPDVPIDDHCGSCRLCLDACPTDAFVEPRVLDATRCIAYTTIEDPGPIPVALRDGHGDRLFGCDVCQEVCPWNRRPSPGTLPDPLGLRARLAPRAVWDRPGLEWLLGLDESAWQQATRGSAMRRAKRRGLLRNALVAAGNAGDGSLRAPIEKLAKGDDAMLAEHARWALARLS